MDLQEMKNELETGDWSHPDNVGEDSDSDESEG